MLYINAALVCFDLGYSNSFSLLPALGLPLSLQDPLAAINAASDFRFVFYCFNTRNTSTVRREDQERLEQGEEKVVEARKNSKTELGGSYINIAMKDHLLLLGLLLLSLLRGGTLCSFVGRCLLASCFFIQSLNLFY